MRKLILTLSVVLCFVLNAAAQDRSISGKVTNEKNAPIEGVSVTSPDGKYGTQTDKDGNYQLTLPASVKALSFSYVNFETAIRSIGKATVINTTLRSADKSLEEVVVIGYGTQQKKAFTGSSSKIDVKEMSTLLTPSIDKQLAGRAAGVQVTTAGGLANTPAVIRIRGIQSITGNNNPLIVVDGTPIITGNLAFATNSNALGDINPADIETIDVLKDGSATAIYGSRAAGGVILITTKKGSRGRSKVTYEGIIGFSSPVKKFDLLNAAEFKTIANEKLTNAGLAARAGVNTSADAYDTDWQDLVMNKNAPNQSHTISLQGGSDKTTFYFSANYNDQKGIVISNYNRAYRVRMNVDHELNKFVKFGNNLSVSRQQDGDQNNGSNSLGGAIASSLRLLPNVSPYSATGWEGYNITYSPTGTSTNSMAIGPNSQSVDDNFFNVLYTMKKNKLYSDKYRFIDNAYMELSPIKGMKFRSQVGIDMFNDYSYTGLNVFHGDGFLTGTSSNSDFNILRLVWSNVLNYNKTIKGHSFFLTVGHEAQTETAKSLSANGGSLTDPFFIAENYITGSGTSNTINGTYDTINGILSFFGRLNYDYKNKYFLQGSIRRDGQSALAPGNKYGTFPGVSVGWRLSEERFWNKKYINELKLKASYAKVGNTLGGYPYLTNFGPRNYGNLGGLGPTGVGNPELVWETSIKYDVGIEVGALNNRINFTGDYFLNDVNNLVIDVPQPLSAGIPGSIDLNGGAIPQNIGKLENRGIELSLNLGIIRNKNFTWDLNVNYSQVNNKIKSLYSLGGVPVLQIPNGNYNVIKTGEPINILWGYQSAGVNAANGNPMFYKADGTLIQLNLSRTTGTVGNFYLASSKNDPVLGTLSSLTAADKVNLGNSTPTYFGAITNSFDYKGFGLDIMLRYSGGNKIMNYTRQEVLFNQSFQNNGREALERWTTPGQITDVPKLYYGQAANINQTASANSRFVEKGDYIRLQNVTFSYTVNPVALEKITKGYVKSRFSYKVKTYGYGLSIKEQILTI
ncbi:MAG: SusC/RagA family TonB-linked outer membrane protein [Chitinophagaceae bacterium]|nr:SusC/RagA family TonB-linked outer membrane protein [Chitinophagaceae bacterium]